MLPVSEVVEGGEVLPSLDSVRRENCSMLIVVIKDVIVVSGIADQ